LGAPAPRGEVSGKRRAIPSVEAVLKKLPFCALVEGEGGGRQEDYLFVYFRGMIWREKGRGGAGHETRPHTHPLSSVQVNPAK